MQAKVDLVLKLAKKSGTPEARMLTAMQGIKQDDESKQAFEERNQKAFATLVKNAYEYVALSGKNLKHLSPGEVAAVFNYSTNDYSSINACCRNGNFMYQGQVSETLKQKIQVTDQTLAKLPNYTGGMTMRGQFPWDGWEKEVKVGQIYRPKAYWSTGVKMSFDYPIQWSVFGKSGKSIEAMSEKPYETEVLFPREAEFMVLSLEHIPRGNDADQNNGLAEYFITVEEV